MEGLWVLLGSALATISGILFWSLNSRTARQVQERQHRHDLEMQEQRLKAERTVSHDEAMRAMKRERLQPVFDLLAEVEYAQAYLIWKDLGARSSLREKVAREFGDVPDEVWSRVMQRLEEDIPPPKGGVMARAIPVINRIEDENLRDKLLLAAYALSTSRLRADEVSKIAHLYADLEQYVAGH